jgi:hypothetical protein
MTISRQKPWAIFRTRLFPQRNCIVKRAFPRLSVLKKD